MILEILLGFALLVIALIDLKYKEVPSFITTIIILGLVLINQANLIWGVAGFLFGLFLYEADFLGGRYFGGVADIKVMAILGLMCTSLTEFAIMMVIVCGVGVIATILRYFYYKTKHKEEPTEFPAIPMLFIAYIILILTKYILSIYV